jgi:hypothetical protein
MAGVGVLYLAALITGLGILGVQFLMPGDAGADADASSDVNAGSGHDAGANHDHGGGGHGVLPFVLSLRFWTFALLAFGLVGALLWFLRLSGSITTLVLATAMGLGSGAFASFTFRALSRAQVSSGGELSDVVGKLGRVLVAPSASSCGKIRIEVRGQAHDYLAKTSDDPIEPGAFVLIDEMRDGIAQVSRAPDDLVPRDALKRS